MKYTCSGANYSALSLLPDSHLYQQESTRVRNIKHTESIRRGNYELGYGEHKSCRVLVLKGNHSNYIMQVEEQFFFLPICSITFLQAEDHCGFQGL